MKRLEKMLVVALLGALHLNMRAYLSISISTDAFHACRHCWADFNTIR